MDRRTFIATLPALTVLVDAVPSFAQESTNTTPNMQPITLPKPEKDGAKSVLAALWERKTNRNVSDQKLPLQTLSNLLWAAWGVNRENGPFGQIGRTAASASNSQEIDLYVAMAEAIYLYEAVPHRLTPIVAGDHRAKAGGRGRGGAAAQAPASLIFVADVAKFSRARLQEPGLRDTEIQKSYYNVATGLIAGNVYLFAASQGLAAWFHNCNKTALAAELKLRPEQRVLYAQTVGYPAKG
jgi:Nitroreductase family